MSNETDDDTIERLAAEAEAGYDIDKLRPRPTTLKQDPDVQEITGAQLGPFLRMRPEARLVVKIDTWLVPVTDVYYDNERGLHVIEVGATAPNQ